MIDLAKTLSNIQNNIDDVQNWADSEYNAYFAQYFKGEVELYKKLQDKDSVISDQELEWVLTTLPLELFSVSEQLERMKTVQEVIRLHIQEIEHEIVNDPTNTDSITKKKEEAARLTSEDRLLIKIYGTLIERVEKQMTFSKELIMSSKKIWDARRSAEIIIPSVDSSDNALPEYSIPDKKTYIK